MIRVDKDKNEVVIGTKDQLYSKVLYGNRCNFMSIPSVEGERRTTAKIRYNSPEVPCTIRMAEEDLIEVVFDEPQRAVTPGQAVVFYDDGIVVGGATIVK